MASLATAASAPAASATTWGLADQRASTSTIERAGEDLRVSTIERYVAALGGKLRVVATFDDDEVEVSRNAIRPE